MTTATLALSIIVGITIPMGLYYLGMYRRQRALVLLVVQRAVHALSVRGVSRSHALDVVAPELREAIGRRIA